MIHVIIHWSRHSPYLWLSTMLTQTNTVHWIATHWAAKPSAYIHERSSLSIHCMFLWYTVLCCTCEAEAWASYQEHVSVERITDHWGSRLRLLCNEQNKRGAISSSLLDPDSNFCLVTCLMSSHNLLNLWVIWWKVKITGACCWVSVLSACCAVQCMRYRSSTVWHHCTVRGLSLNLTLSSLVQTAPLFQTAERDSEPWTAPMCPFCPPAPLFWPPATITTTSDCLIWSVAPPGDTSRLLSAWMLLWTSTLLISRLCGQAF